MKEEQKDKYLKWISENLENQKEKFKKYLSNKHQSFNEDIFSNTILKVAEKINKDGIQDESEVGFENYLFKSFKINTMRERQYSRNSKRDLNVDDVQELWREYYDSTMESENEKLKRDLKKDFSILYIANRIIEHFGEQSAHVFLSKFFFGWTYKQLNEHYKIPKLRDKMIEIKKWLQTTISKDEIDKAFWDRYGNDFE